MNVSKAKYALIHWVEETPEIISIRQKIEADGLIRELIDRLQSDPKSFKTSENVGYNDESGFQEYVCIVERNNYQHLLHNYIIHINPARRRSFRQYEATGWAYVGRDVRKNVKRHINLN